MEKEIISEMVDDMIQSFGLFQSENENFKTTFSYEFLEYWNNKLSIVLVTEADCMEVYRNNDNVPEFQYIRRKIDKDIRTIEKYGIVDNHPYTKTHLIRKNFEFWKNTELKKLKKRVKERFGKYVHAIRVDFDNNYTLFPRLKVIFSREYSNWSNTRYDAIREIQNFMSELGFSKQIRLNW